MKRIKNNEFSTTLSDKCVPHEDNGRGDGRSLGRWSFVQLMDALVPSERICLHTTREFVFLHG